MFLGKANAPTKDEKHDIQINACLKILKEASKKQLNNAYCNYRKQYKIAIPTWKIYRYLEHLLNKLSWNLDNICYANIVPFRYIGNPKNIAYKKSFKFFTNVFLNTITPEIIIPLGIDLHHTIKKYYENALVFDGVERTNGDNSMLDRTSDYLDEIADYIKQSYILKLPPSV